MRQHCLYRALDPISGHAQSDLYRTFTGHRMYVHSCHSKIQERSSRSPVRDILLAERTFPSVEVQLTNWGKEISLKLCQRTEAHWTWWLSSPKLAWRELIKVQMRKVRVFCGHKNLFSQASSKLTLSLNNINIFFIYILYETIYIVISAYIEVCRY